MEEDYVARRSEMSTLFTSHNTASCAQQKSTQDTTYSDNCDLVSAL